MSSDTAAICVNIFALPQPDAAMMIPRPDAIDRRPDTANSRPMTTTTIQAGARPSSTSEMNAAEIRSLSAIGSSSVPSVVISPAPAREPAVEKIRRDGRQEDQEPHRLPPVELRQQHDDEKRHEEDAQERQRVGKVDLQNGPAEL